MAKVLEEHSVFGETQGTGSFLESRRISESSPVPLDGLLRGKHREVPERGTQQSQAEKAEVHSDFQENGKWL